MLEYAHTHKSSAEEGSRFHFTNFRLFFPPVCNHLLSCTVYSRANINYKGWGMHIGMHILSHRAVLIRVNCQQNIITSQILAEYLCIRF